MFFDNLLYSLSKANDPVDVRSKRLPSSLLIRLFENSYGAYIEEIRQATYSKKKVVQFQKHDGGRVGFTLDKSQMKTAISWSRSHGIPCKYEQTLLERVIKGLSNLVGKEKFPDMTGN